MYSLLIYDTAIRQTWPQLHVWFGLTAIDNTNYCIIRNVIELIRWEMARSFDNCLGSTHHTLTCSDKRCHIHVRKRYIHTQYCFCRVWNGCNHQNSSFFIFVSTENNWEKTTTTVQSKCIRCCSFFVNSTNCNRSRLGMEPVPLIEIIAVCIISLSVVSIIRCVSVKGISTTMLLINLF